jgi:alcohol dehydrogenase class IV
MRKVIILIFVFLCSHSFGQSVFARKFIDYLQDVCKVEKASFNSLTKLKQKKYFDNFVEVLKKKKYTFSNQNNFENIQQSLREKSHDLIICFGQGNLTQIQKSNFLIKKKSKRL